MTKQIVIDNIDVLVIGGGIAGAFASIKAKEAGSKKVAEVAKGRVGRSGMSFSGAVLHHLLPGQDINDRLRRLARSLGYLAQQDVIKDHLEQSLELPHEMESFGVKFLRTPEGELLQGAARGYYPVTWISGPQMMEAMRQTTLNKGVEQFNKTMIIGLLTQDGRVVGAAGFNIETGDFYIFKSRATILASGSNRYKGLMTAHRDATGDSYAIAYQAGAVLSGAENNDELANVSARLYDIGSGINVYAGLGGKFINAKGERYMEVYNPHLKDRAGLRIITTAAIMETKRGNGPLWVDMTSLTPEQVNRLRTVLPAHGRKFERAGYIVGGKFVKPVEYTVAGPVGRAGIVVNRKFESSLPGLYACGEAGDTNAVATGLAGGATSGATAGRAAAEYAKGVTDIVVDQAQLEQLMEYTFRPLERKDGVEPEQVILSLQEAIIPYDILLVRHGQRMKKALDKVEDIRDNEASMLHAYDTHYLRMAHEAASMLFVAELQLRSAILRTESRVGLREDYPYMDNVNWLKWIRVKKAEAGMELFTEDVPIEQYPIKAEREKSLNYLWQVAEKIGIIAIKEGEVVWV